MTLCESCNGRQAKRNKKLCDPCIKAKDKDNAGTNIGSEKKVLNHQVLMYCEYHRHNSSKANIVRVSAAFFDDEEIADAKAMLWNIFGDEVLGQCYDRHDSSNRISKEANMEDILKALADLEDNSINVQCVTNVWNRVPKVSPEAVNELSLAEKLAEMEAKLSTFENNLTSIRSDMISDKEKSNREFTKLGEECKTHGELISQIIHREEKTVNARPSMAQVVAAGTIPSHIPQQAGAGSQQAVNQGQLAAGPRRGNRPTDVQTRVKTPVGGHQRTRSEPGTNQQSGNNNTVFIQPRYLRRQNRRGNTQNHNTIGSDTQSGMRRQRAPPVVGAGQSSIISAAPLPNRDFFVSRVMKSTTEEHMKAHCLSKGVTCTDIKQTNHQDAMYSSFKISVSYNDAVRIREPNFWPEGIWLRKWHEVSQE